ncbi:MAG: radical SAM protein [Planctomycetota bacterium]|nr:radical SAM protein [Planctomycetota bacterium]
MAQETNSAPSTQAPATALAPRPAPRIPPLDNAPRSFLKEQVLLARLGWRAATSLSMRAAWKAAYLYAFKGMLAVNAYKRRQKRGELYPPFMFIALTNTCNLRCHGCWVEKEGTAHYLTPEDIDRIIVTGKKQKAYYYTLLGGEPFMYKGLFEIFERHKDCYFQVITNGMFFSDENVRKLKACGNVTPLISLDGWKDQNDLRRGKGVFEAAEKGLERLKKAGVLFGIACTATGPNMEDVMSDAFVEHFIQKGALYIWYYVYRPMGSEMHDEYCVAQEQLVWFRKRLLEMRRKHPMFIIDTYWTAKGEAFCPAAVGLGYHIGPQGSIEICPALSFAKDTVRDRGGDLYATINESNYLRGFTKFVKERTKGCVILEYPQQLHEYIRESGAQDYSGRGTAFKELNAIVPRHSQHMPNHEIPEDFWFYRFLKSQVFFGMGAM